MSEKLIKGLRNKIIKLTEENIELKRQLKSLRYTLKLSDEAWLAMSNSTYSSVTIEEGEKEQ